MKVSFFLSLGRTVESRRGLCVLGALRTRLSSSQADRPCATLHSHGGHRRVSAVGHGFLDLAHS